MDQLVECLPCMHENLSSIPNTMEPGVAAGMSIPELGRIPELTESSLTGELQTNERPCFQGDRLCS